MTWFLRELTPDDERIVTEFMSRLASRPVPASPVLTGHSAIWWKAQLLRRWDAQREAVKPLAVMEPIQLLAGIAAAALVFLWALPSLTSALGQVVASL